MIGEIALGTWKPTVEGNLKVAAVAMGRAVNCRLKPLDAVRKRSGEESKDEPFAWDAREYLRKKLVGREVVFTVEYKVPSSQREYGFLFLGKGACLFSITEYLVENAEWHAGCCCCCCCGQMRRRARTWSRA